MNLLADPEEAVASYMNGLLRISGDFLDSNIPSKIDIHNQIFECSLIKVAGIKFAVPQYRCSEILEFPAIWLSIGADDEMVVGAFEHEQKNVMVGDLSRIVIPEQRRESLLGKNDGTVSQVLLLDDGSWGLVVDEVAGSCTVEPEHVRWSDGDSKRQWLAGMLIDHGSVLLDIDEILKILQVKVPDEEKGL